MSDIGKNALKTKIDAKIYDNESQLISGTILNEVLQDAVDTLADGGNLDEGSVDTANLKDEAVTKGKLAQNVSADLDWAVASNSYYRNSQAGDVAAKVITTYKDINLRGGGSLKVTFENVNTANDATLNIDGKGAKPLYYNGKRVSSTNSWEAGETVEIYYNNYNSGAYYAKRWMVEPVSVSQNTLTIGDNPTSIISSHIVDVNALFSKTDAYTSAYAGRHAVPDNLKVSGLLITYMLSDGWHIEHYISDDITDWDVEGNWENLDKLILLIDNADDAPDNSFNVRSGNSGRIAIPVITNTYQGEKYQFELRAYSGQFHLLCRKYTEGTGWGGYSEISTYNTMQSLPLAKPLLTQFYINSSNEIITSSTNIGLLIPVLAGSSLEIRANEQEPSYYCFFKTVSNGGLPSGRIGTRTSIAQNTSATVSVPNDANYIWVYITATDHFYCPKKVIMNGKYSIVDIENLHNANNDIRQKNTTFVIYDATNHKFDVRTRISENKYASFVFSLNSSLGEMQYVYLWRLTDGGIYNYNPFVNKYKTSQMFTLVQKSTYLAENEFAIKYQGKADYTGGYHGDERIDIDASSYVKFIIDGHILTQSELSQSFEMWCDTFEYMQFSTLHETSNDGSTPITGHPIVAYHFKDGIVADGKYNLHNVLIPNGSATYEDAFTGLYCFMKNVGNKAIISGQEIDASQGNNNATIATDKIARKAYLYNADNNISASVWSELVRGNQDDEDTVKDIMIWDRSTDTKYYRHLQPSAINGEKKFETNMIVEFFA